MNSTPMPFLEAIRARGNAPPSVNKAKGIGQGSGTDDDAPSPQAKIPAAVKGGGKSDAAAERTYSSTPRAKPGRSTNAGAFATATATASASAAAAAALKSQQRSQAASQVAPKTALSTTPNGFSTAEPPTPTIDSISLKNSSPDCFAEQPTRANSPSPGSDRDAAEKSGKGKSKAKRGKQAKEAGVEALGQGGSRREVEKADDRGSSRNVETMSTVPPVHPIGNFPLLTDKDAIARAFAQGLTCRLLPV